VLIVGVDVFGRQPTTKEGQHFNNSWWGWRPLANYIAHVAPTELTGKCAHWQSNDGAGLDGPDSLALATLLQGEIDSGRTSAYERRYVSDQEEMTPDDFETNYPFNENVQNFATFLKGCGGFEIW
jgi:hypothetical protein